MSSVLQLAHCTIFLHNSTLITFQRSSNDEAMWDEKLQNWQIFRTNWMDMGYTCCTPLWFDRYRNLIFKTIIITSFNEMEYFALYGFFFKFTTLKRYTYKVWEINTTLLGITLYSTTGQVTMNIPETNKSICFCSL